jgi:uncharacterized protein YqeY
MSDDRGGLRDRLRDGLPAAIKARDGVAVAALRSALAAIDNAGAVAPPPGSPTEATHAQLAGTVEGVGAAEAERRALSEAEVERIVQAEADERRAAADAYERADRPEVARRLRAEADVLGGHLDRRP